MSHYVTCVYCSQRFDRDKEPTIKVSKKRYAHLHCVPEQERDYVNLMNYICELFDTHNQPYSKARIEKQLYTYKQEYNYTFSGMLGTLIWWYEIKQNSLDKANGGVGIIPYIYEDAKRYYIEKDRAQNINSEEDIKNFDTKVIEIVIEPPVAYGTQPKLFRLEE